MTAAWSLCPRFTLRRGGVGNAPPALHLGVVAEVDEPVEALSLPPGWDAAPAIRTAFFSPWALAEIAGGVNADAQLADVLPLAPAPRRRCSARDLPPGACVRSLAAGWGVDLSTARTRVEGAVARGDWLRGLAVAPHVLQTGEDLLRALSALPVFSETELAAQVRRRDALRDWLDIGSRFARAEWPTEKVVCRLQLEAGLRAMSAGSSVRPASRSARTCDVVHEEAVVQAPAMLSNVAADDLLCALSPLLDIGLPHATVDVDLLPFRDVDDALAWALRAMHTGEAPFDPCSPPIWPLPRPRVEASGPRRYRGRSVIARSPSPLPAQAWLPGPEQAPGDGRVVECRFTLLRVAS